MLLRLFFLLALLHPGSHAKKDKATKKAFKKGFEKFADRERKHGREANKTKRYKIFKKNHEKYRSIATQGRRFKLNEKSFFLYLSEDEAELYTGLANLTEFSGLFDVEHPKKAGRPTPSFKRSNVKKHRDVIRKGKSGNGNEGKGNKGKGNNNGNSNPSKRQVVSGEDEEMPESLDLRNLNLVTAIKDQGSCGSCWAFGALTVLEGAFALTTGIIRTFSEQQVIDCNELFGCSGGFWPKAWKAIQTDRYVGLMEEHPYRVTKDPGQCDKEATNGMTDIMNIGLYDVLRQDDDELQMLAHMATYGPVTVVVNADVTLFYYGSGIIDDCLGGRDGNHLVALIGYDLESLLLKNSWSTDWGEGGFFHLRRGCGVAGYSYWASYLTVVSHVPELISPFSSNFTEIVTKTFTQKDRIQVVSLSLKSAGTVLAEGDVITVASKEGLEELSIVIVDLLFNKDKVLRLKHTPTKSKCNLYTIQDGSKLHQTSTECPGNSLALGSNFTISIIITSTGYSISYREVQLPHYTHVLPFDTINKITVKAKTSTGMFSQITINRQQVVEEDTAGLVTQTCVDKDSSYCPGYVSDGYICEESEWMRDNCPWTCHLCDLLISSR